MSEDKPLPCAFCREVPSSCFHNHFGEYVISPTCLKPDCLCRYVCNEMFLNDDVRIMDWNIFCIKALEQRRKDFEAGRLTIAFNRDNVGGDWLEIKTFDEYIKERK